MTASLMKCCKKKTNCYSRAGLIGSTMAIALASKGLDVTVVDGTSGGSNKEK